MYIGDDGMDGVFDTVTGWFTSNNTENPKVDETADPGMIDGFKIKARKWAQKVVDLFNIDTHGNKELEERKQSLLKWAKYIKTGVESIFGTIDELEKINLGFIPLIPVAAILASVAAMGKWYKDYAEFQDKLKLHKSLMQSGASAKDAAIVVDKLTANKPLVDFSSMKSVIPVLGVVGFGAWWLSRKKR